MLPCLPRLENVPISVFEAHLPVHCCTHSHIADKQQLRSYVICITIFAKTVNKSRSILNVCVCVCDHRNVSQLHAPCMCGLVNLCYCWPALVTMRCGRVGNSRFHCSISSSVSVWLMHITRRIDKMRVRTLILFINQNSSSYLYIGV